MFSNKDIKQLEQRSISTNEAERQISVLINGIPYLKLAKPANEGCGVISFNKKEIQQYNDIYEKAEGIRLVKFVPASGAATRMFKALHEADKLLEQNDFNPKILDNEAYSQVNECFSRLRDFAFYNTLETILNKKGYNLDLCLKEKRYHIILKHLLGPDGLYYENMPKGLILFHKYADSPRTAFEEHLVEGTGYAKSSNGEVNIHLTVAEEHRSLFEYIINKTGKTYEKLYNASYHLEFSIQKPSTDTLAVDNGNNPVREDDGSLHFRPAGHGALLENLNDTDADLIFIKNIDNVAPDAIKNDTFIYKKALAGVLIEYKQKINNYLQILEKKELIADDLLNEIYEFIKNHLGTDFGNKSAVSREQLYKKLNRPLRVCGMVRNTGEPGGGPFWVENSEGYLSLQIVESSQVNHKDSEQEAIFNSAQFFNPVDIVCWVKNFRNEKFDLIKYRDPETGFISKKYKDGKPLKALELPGLWNGGMADWNTVFVEVPVSTFNPVKTLHDLLRPEHQA